MSDDLPIWGAGILSGVLVLGILILGVGDVPENWIYHYQTLIAGGIALASALVTVGFIQRQIRATKDQHNDLITRSSVAARSVLPMVLSDLNRYAENCLTIAIEIAKKETLSKEIYRPDDGVFEAFQKAINYAPDTQQIEMWELLSALQIQISRIESSYSNYVPPSAAEIMYRDQSGLGDDNYPSFQAIFDAEDLLYRITNLYGYARAPSYKERAGNLPSERIDRFVSSFLLRRDIEIESWPKLMEVAKRRFDKKQVKLD